MKSDMETKSLVGDSPSGSGTTFILIFIVTVIIVNFISKVFAGKSKLSLSEFYDRILEFFSLTWFFTKQMFGDAEVVLQSVIHQLSRYEQTPRNIKLGLLHFIFVDKPEDLQVVLNNSNSLQKSKFYKFFKTCVGEGLFTAPVHKWRKHRRLITPVFNARLFENFFGIFNEKNKMLIKRLESVADTEQIIDLWDFVAPTALDIICETAMNFDAKGVNQEKEKHEFQELVVKVSEEDSMRIYKVWLHPDFIFKIYSKLNGHLEDLEKVRKLPMEIIQYKKQQLQEKKAKIKEITDTEKKNTKTTTFLDTLLDLNEQGAEFSDQDLYDEVITMMIGGSETSAITNCFTLLMLAIHPHMQEKVYKEVISVLGTEDRYIEMKDVQNMPFLEQCIKETLRLFPTGPLILREATDDFKLSGDFTVQKGATIIIPPIMVHRNPNIYKNPMVWNPDNFSPEETEKRHKYSFLAFSGGPRGCIGSKYALLSMKLTISMIIKNYYVTTDIKLDDIRLKLDLLLRSVNGYKVKIQVRKPTK